MGAEEPPAYARCRLTAEDFGHRNGPSLIPRMQGKRKDLADLWSRGTGDPRRPALGPHGIAHAHPLGRVHAARQERRRGLRHGLRRFAGGPEAPHVSRADPEAGLRWPQLIRIGPEDSTGMSPK